MSGPYRVMPDGGVVDAAGDHLGRVALLMSGGAGKPPRWIALDARGLCLAGPSKVRDLAVLHVIRESHPDATLADMVVTI